MDLGPRFVLARIRWDRLALIALTLSLWAVSGLVVLRFL
jgi:hypothetical protein